jgi:hypothetical protein
LGTEWVEWNLYEFVKSSPNGYLDPLGLQRSRILVKMGKTFDANPGKKDNSPGFVQFVEMTGVEAGTGKPLARKTFQLRQKIWYRVRIWDKNCRLKPTKRGKMVEIGNRADGVASFVDIQTVPPKLLGGKDVCRVEYVSKHAVCEVKHPAIPPKQEDTYFVQTNRWRGLPRAMLDPTNALMRNRPTLQKDTRCIGKTTIFRIYHLFNRPGACGHSGENFIDEVALHPN